MPSPTGLTADALRLETPRLSLRIPGPADAARYAAYFAENRARLARMNPVPEGAASPAFWEQRLSDAAQEFEEDRGARLAAFLRDDPDGPLVGVCNLFGMVRVNVQACHIGYHVGGAFEGRGLMREAVEATIEFAFGPMDLHRLWANYHPLNERSGGLLRRLGFVVEGYARDLFYLNDAWQDCILTAKVNPRPQRPALPQAGAPGR